MRTQLRSKPRFPTRSARTHIVDVIGLDQCGHSVSDHQNSDQSRAKYISPFVRLSGEYGQWLAKRTRLPAVQGDVDQGFAEFFVNPQGDGQGDPDFNHLTIRLARLVNGIKISRY